MLKKHLSKLFTIVLVMSTMMIHAQSLVQVTEPADAAGVYYSIEGSGSLDVSVPVSGPVVIMDDGDTTDTDGDGTFGTTSDGCQAALNDLTGAIALIDRGDCGMDVKAANAAAAGAVGIILCNNNINSPTQLVVPGGGDGATTIPTVGMSLADCTILQTSTNVVLTIFPSPNYLCAEALAIEPGTIEVDSIMGDPAFGNALGFGASAASQADGGTFAMWYSFTAATSGLVNVNSCLGGADTRLKVWTGDCDVFGTGDLVLVADDDDSCPFLPDGSGEAYASSVSFYATAGVRYLIEWDDRWMNPNTPFSFNLSFEDTPFEPAPGEDCANAIVIDPGTHVIDALEGFGSNADNSLASEWYSFTPAMDGVATISSCNSAGPSEDTRVLVYNGECDALVFLAEGEDECDALSQIGPFPITAGTTYLIEWADTWSAEGFDWELSLVDFPALDVTVTVDMAAETVDPAGVFLAYAPSTATNPTDIMASAMTDNGDNTWSATIQVTAFDTIGYLFVNGVPDIVGFSNAEVVPDECSVTTAFGFNARVLAAATLDPIDVPAVCFASCSTCEPEDCNNPLTLIFDDFEEYTLGAGVLGPQALHWTTWSGTEGGGEDANVVDVQGNVGQSIEIGGSGAQDILLLLGNKTEGHYYIGVDHYIPSGSTAYYNMQHFETVPMEWACEIYFDAGGTGRLLIGGETRTFTYPHDTWFQTIHLVDLDNDMTRLIVDEFTIAAWPFNWQSGIASGTNQLGGLNFFSASPTNLHYIDNVVYAQIPAATEGNYCYTAVAANTGMNTTPDLECFGGGYDLGGGDGAEKGYWFTWTAEEDGVLSITSCNGGADTRGWIFSGTDCTNLALVGINDDQCDQGDGNPYATIREAVVTAGTMYYIMWDNAWSPDGFDWDLTFTAGVGTAGNFCQTAIPLDIGGEYEIDEINGNAAVVGPNIGTSGTTSTTPYAQSEWYTFTPDSDMMVTISSCDGAANDTEVWVYTGDCSTIPGLTLVATDDDGCGIASIIEMEMEAGVTYYIEWGDRNSDELFAWTFDAVVAPTTAVTFTVDASLETVSAEGLFISGPFNEWANPGNPMTDAGDGRWTVTLELEQETTVEYKYQNGTDGWENNMPEACNMNGNRFVVVGTEPMTVEEVCFNHCVDCDTVLDIVDPAFAAAITVFPNPTDDQTSVTYDFENKINLTIRVVNSLGQVISSDLIADAISGTHTLDVSDMAAGIYMIQITDGERLATQSLVVE